MNKTEKELIATQLKKEQRTIKKLKKQYEVALKKIEEKIIILQSSKQTQSKIYQIQYQKALKSQLEALLSNIQSNNYQTIDEYINSEYIDGWIGTFYNLRYQGIPIIAPINQESIVKAVQLNTKLSRPLYESLGINTTELKKTIRNEISRGIASGLGYQEISRNISNVMKIDLNKSIRIAVTEGHRVQNEAKMEAYKKAKDYGADIVKQWDATLDKKTRLSHAKVDGEIREIDEKFSNGLMYPGDKNGKAKEVIRCRCVMLERARWALDEEELETLKERAKFYGLDKSKNFEEFKNKYIDISKAIDFMGKPFKFNNNCVSIKGYAVNGTNNVYIQTYSTNSQKMIDYLKSITQDLPGLENIDKIIVAKELNGVAAYDHENDWLFVNEKVTNEDYITKQLGTGYFVAENVFEILQHEMFHKKHWDYIRTKEKKDGIMKSEVEASLRKYVKTQKQMDFNYLVKNVSFNAHYSLLCKDSLNELIADVLLLEQKGMTVDENLLKLVKECVEG